MEGMLGGMFGAAGSIGGALIAADAQKYSANTNWAIALMNYYARERERTQARFEAQRIEAKQNLGFTDAQGGGTKFVEGKGWVQTLGPAQAALQKREQAEQMARLGTDAQMRRHQLQRNEIRQIREEDKSKALFEEMRKKPPVTPQQLENTLYNAATTGMNREFADTQGLASRQALRTNNAQQAPAIFAELARTQSEAQAGAKTKAHAQAMQMAPAINAEDEKMRTNLYNLFATRAGAMPDISFSPTPIDSGAAQQASRQDMGGGLKAAMMEGGRLPFMPPLYGTANAVGAIGAAGQGFMRNMQPQQPQFAEAGGPGNLWGAIGEDYKRLRGNQGYYAG